MRCTIGAIVTIVALPWLSGAGQAPPDKKPLREIGEIMMKAHKPNKRQLYRALDQLVISGRATAEEKKRLVEHYEALAQLTPPAGTIESWKKNTAAMVAAAKAVASGDDSAAVRLLQATNCAACHEKYGAPPCFLPGRLQFGLQRRTIS